MTNGSVVSPGVVGAVTGRDVEWTIGEVALSGGEVAMTDGEVALSRGKVGMTGGEGYVTLLCDDYLCVLYF